MKIIIRFIAILIIAILLMPILSEPCLAQVFEFNRKQMIEFTKNNQFDRFADGRPKVPDTLLEKVKELKAQDVFEVLPEAEYPNQFENNWQILHPEQKLVGRAVTAQFMPYRSDIAEVSESKAKAKGLAERLNHRVVNMLQPGDVVVVDLFGKVNDGTFSGDNLATAIYATTKTGFVINGGIRDLQGIMSIGMPGYFRGAHPSAFRDVMLTAINTPVRIGNVTVMPGDVVFGDREGVYFIPPHMVEKVINTAVENHIRDDWAKEKLLTGKYKMSDLFPIKDAALKREYEKYRQKRLRQGKR